MKIIGMFIVFGVLETIFLSCALFMPMFPEIWKSLLLSQFILLISISLSLLICLGAYLITK